MSARPISVVIRAKDEAASIGRTLELLERQTVRPEVVVVDSGSTDGSTDIVRAHDAKLVQIPATSFTFGGALNTGAEHATAEVVVALSAHAFPKDDAWLQRMLDAMADPDVACASGQSAAPDGAPLDHDVVQDLALARAYPLWGYSSHAGAFRRSLWTQRGFRTDMTASEDKEWAWHWLERGHKVVLGPASPSITAMSVTRRTRSSIARCASGRGRVPSRRCRLRASASSPPAGGETASATPVTRGRG